MKPSPLANEAAGSVVLVAPDKFKGSLTAGEAAGAITKGLKTRHPQLTTIELPVADGGDGTLDAFLANGYTRLNIEVTGPDGEPAPSAVGLKDRVAVIETALTSGLVMCGGKKLNPLNATSWGVGDAIKAALDAGARKIIIGLGGSACTDGGAGMLVALGASLTDAAGSPVALGGIGLLDLAEVRLSGLDSRVRHTEIVLATDVTNPLCGANGAAAVYGPQKGATEEDIQLLDRALSRFANMLAPEMALQPGAGAAGGIGFGALAALGAIARPGVDLILELLNFEEHLRSADLVITGEGRLDDQSLQGKAPVGVLAAAARHNVPTVAVCGLNELDPNAQHPKFHAIHAISDIASDSAEAMRDASALLERIAAGITLPVSGRRQAAL